MINKLKIISPHLNIYNLELQSGLSILNRICGLILTLFIFYFIIMDTLLYETFIITHFSYILYYLFDLIQEEYEFTIGVTMSLIILIHFFCGIRHIIWDLNIGLTKKALKISHLIIITIILTSLTLDVFFQTLFTLIDNNYFELE
uniref:Succinate dehydrogenase subunit 3 n=1 Tax=Cyanophora paradoxa TaxID=2762 RepID=E9P1E8_CYAPA|nr:succinate dehydrogenase subunit 3 [Cyanophora paradoxa]ADW79200.1 succinate dehydrogenase subunit 3 [Cyanophora paradoxa]